MVVRKKLKSELFCCYLERSRIRIRIHDIIENISCDTVSL
jgi:hypothetical protein